MLSLYFVQLWCNFSDERTEDTRYDMPVLARLIGIVLSSERVANAITQKSFRRLLEYNPLTPKILLVSQNESLH